MTSVANPAGAPPRRPAPQRAGDEGAGGEGGVGRVAEVPQTGPREPAEERRLSLVTARRQRWIKLPRHVAIHLESCQHDVIQLAPLYKLMLVILRHARLKRRRITFKGKGWALKVGDFVMTLDQMAKPASIHAIITDPPFVLRAAENPRSTEVRTRRSPQSVSSVRSGWIRRGLPGSTSGGLPE